ncbi:hypothetical protein [Methylobacterium sp. D54C]
MDRRLERLRTIQVLRDGPHDPRDEGGLPCERAVLDELLGGDRPVFGEDRVDDQTRVPRRGPDRPGKFPNAKQIGQARLHPPEACVRCGDERLQGVQEVGRLIVHLAGQPAVAAGDGSGKGSVEVTARAVPALEPLGDGTQVEGRFSRKGGREHLSGGRHRVVHHLPSRGEIREVAGEVRGLEGQGRDGRAALVAQALQAPRQGSVQPCELLTVLGLPPVVPRGENIETGEGDNGEAEERDDADEAKLDDHGDLPVARGHVDRICTMID